MREIDFIAQSGNSIYYSFETMHIGILLILLLKIVLTKNKIKYYTIFEKLLVFDIFLIITHLIRISKLYSVYKHLDYTILFIFYIVFAASFYNIFKFYCNIIHMDDINNFKSKFIFSIPFLISLRYIFINENSMKASFGLLTLIIVVVMTVYSVFYCLVVNKAYSDRVHILVLPLIPILFVYFHIQYPSIPIGLGITLNALLGYVLVTDLSISTDQLTNLNNRQNLYGYIEHKLRHNVDLHVIMIDADDFKLINDKYGHIEGDKCLIRISESIKEACNFLSSRAFICRYGGDEFIIVTDCSDKEVAVLKQNINSILDKANSMSKIKAYVSIGVATRKLSDPDISAVDLIDKADKDLYKSKRRNKK